MAKKSVVALKSRAPLGFAVFGVVFAALAGLYLTQVGLRPFLRGDGPIGSAQEQIALRERTVSFVSVVVEDTTLVWGEVFAVQLKRRYSAPDRMVFSNASPSPCARQGMVSGPAYCAINETVYIDTAFFEYMDTRLRQGSEFAASYLTAHAVGHHVQHLLGDLEPALRIVDAAPAAQARAVALRLELQADCYAGIWARRGGDRARELKEHHVKAAISQAVRSLEDYSRVRNRKGVILDKMDVGTEAQKEDWFLRGYRSAGVSSCDTFAPGAI